MHADVDLAVMLRVENVWLADLEASLPVRPKKMRVSGSGRSGEGGLVGALLTGEARDEARCKGFGMFALGYVPTSCDVNGNDVVGGLLLHTNNPGPKGMHQHIIGCHAC